MNYAAKLMENIAHTIVEIDGVKYVSIKWDALEHLKKRMCSVVDKKHHLVIMSMSSDEEIMSFVAGLK